MPESYSARDPAYATVIRFTRGIIQALHDVEHETMEDARIVHFWDTDSLYLPARGAAVYSEGTSASRINTSTFVQSLYATGFLGKVQLLRPHRAEFIALLAEWEQDRTLEDRFGRGRDNILGGDHLAMVRALEHLLEADELDENAQQNAVDYLRKLPRDEFTYLEAASGSWRGRLGRLLEQDLLDLKRHGFSTEFLRGTPEYAKIFDRLNNQKLKRGVTRRLSIAADAAALTSLIYMLEDVRGGGRVFPRFFTSTPRLKRLYNDWPEFRADLEFDHNGLPPTTATIWRDSVYYLVRAIFPALRMPGRVQEVRPGDSSVSVAYLGDLSQKLIEALRESDEEPSRRLRNLLRRKVFENEEATLAEVINRLEDNRVSSAWLSFASGALPKDTIEMLRGLRRLAKLERTQQLIADDETTSFHDVREVVREFRSVAIVVAALERFSGFLQKREMSIKDDLGSARWGIELTHPQDTIAFDPRAVSTVDSLTEEFSVDVLQGKPVAQLRAYGILFGMERFDLAAELMFELTQEPLPAQSAMLRAVATIRSQPFSESELVAAVRQLKADWKALALEERPSQALGFAIAAFSAWQRSKRGGKDVAHPRDDRRWAEWSIKRVQKWRHLMKPHAQLQAKNHLVYVGITANKVIPEYASMLVELEAHATQHNDFHLLDTVGFAIVRSFMPDAGDERREIDPARFRQGLAYLDRARALFPEDLEIIGHQQRAIAFARENDLVRGRI